MAGKTDKELKNMVMSFRVAELTTLLTFAGRAKTGRKQDLQKKALELIKLKTAPIQMKIIEIFHKGELARNEAGPPLCNGHQPTPDNQHRYLPPKMAGTYDNYYKELNIMDIIQNSSPEKLDLKIKQLPFFEHIGEIVKPSFLVGAGYFKLRKQFFQFSLTAAQVDDFLLQGSEVVQVHMRFCLLGTTCELKDCFPPGLEVLVRGKSVKLPPQTLSNRPGMEDKRPAVPVNITSLVDMTPNVTQMIDVSWSAEAGKEFVIAVELVKKLTAFHLMEKMEIRGVKCAASTKKLIQEKLCEDADCEVATKSLRLSLTCPLAKTRMALPCRPISCTHLQCFDALMFLHMNAKKPTWTCPVCDQPSDFDELVIDGYFQDVLSSDRLPSDVSEIELHTDGSWSVPESNKEDETNSASLSKVRNRRGPPVVMAIVEITDDDLTPPDVSLNSAAHTITKPVVEKAADVTTVDLTFSDDDDDVEVTLLPRSDTNPLDNAVAEVIEETLHDKADSSSSRNPVADSSSNFIDLVYLDSPTPSPPSPPGTPVRLSSPLRTYSAASSAPPTVDSLHPLSSA